MILMELDIIGVKVMQLAAVQHQLPRHVHVHWLQIIRIWEILMNVKACHFNKIFSLHQHLIVLHFQSHNLNRWNHHPWLRNNSHQNQKLKSKIKFSRDVYYLCCWLNFVLWWKNIHDWVKNKSSKVIGRFNPMFLCMSCLYHGLFYFWVLFSEKISIISLSRQSLSRCESTGWILKDLAMMMWFFSMKLHVFSFECTFHTCELHWQWAGIILGKWKHFFVRKI